MFRPSRCIPAAVLALLLVAPAAAVACSIAATPLNQRPVPQSEVVRVERVASTRADWGLRPGWLSVRPQLAGGVRVEGGSSSGTFGIARRDQRLLRFTATDPRGLRRWADDADPATSCPEVGQRVYSRPRLLVQQGAETVAITFVATRNVPTGTGCRSVHPSVDGQVAGIDSCADVAFGAVLLREPIGDRRLQVHLVLTA